DAERRSRRTAHPSTSVAWSHRPAMAWTARAEQSPGVSTLRSGGSRCHRPGMPNYLVESYLADSPAAVEQSRQRAVRTAELGQGVRYVRTTFLPDDETVLHVFEAPSPEAITRAGSLAG